MDYPLEILSDIDVFYYYGEPDSDLLLETESDIFAGILQPKRTLFYNRRDASGVVEKENLPTSLILSLMTAFDITNWNSYRNTQVSDGANGTPDRRVAISQNSVQIQQRNEKGEMDVLVEFIPFANLKNKKDVTIPIPS